MSAKQPRQRTYSDEFMDRIARLDEEALAAGTNLTEVCREAGVSRATPDRWRRHVPKTIQLVTLMEQIIQQHARKAAKQK